MNADQKAAWRAIHRTVSLFVDGEMPLEQWDMRTWMAHDQCGTVGCALGWSLAKNPKIMTRLGFDRPKRGIPIGRFFHFQMLGITGKQFAYCFTDHDSEENDPSSVLQRIEQVMKECGMEIEQ